MRATLYLETSVISYLASTPSNNLIIAGNQATTREWWSKRHAFEMFVSQLVVNEASAGDPEQAAKRLQLIEGLPILNIADSAEDLARLLLARVPLPDRASDDALHIAIAAVNGLEILVTWNCRHIANFAMRPRIEYVLRQADVEPPTICTPQELIDV